MAIQIFGATAPALIVWYINRPKQKSSPKTRLIRKEGQIAKTKLKHETENAQRALRHQTELKILEIDRQTILKEIAYDTERFKLESGLGEKRGESEPEMPSTPEGQNKLDLLSGLKQQGANLFQKGVGQVKQVAEEKINQATKAVNEKANQFTKTTGDKIDEITKKVKPKKEE
ncbi:7218_t:CDS:1 [Racocetra persica]|uniref:7218_t:CDS:1 n=1 Tax=Racocetra persica TaxID=160502 RepID=A0ACA9LD90_9GLOM|nr:7218_t:CDS:1 [Racocetra persica]